MTILLILAHVSDPAPFAAELATRPDAGVIELRPLVVPGLSGVYHALAASLRRASVEGRLLPALLRHVRASRPVTGYDRIVFVSWSAPYALAQELLSREDDAASLAGWVALDSGYGAVTPGEVALALRAREGKAILWSGATEVPTTGYASSRAHLAELCRRAGEPTGGFHVELWDHDVAAYHAAPDKAAFWREEHISALHRGPAFVARALAALDKLTAYDLPDAPAPPPPTLRATEPDRSAKALQRALNDRGATPVLMVDGDIGHLTRAATRAFQAAHGLPETGVADEATWAALGALGGPFGLAVLDVARADLAAKIREVGHNAGPDIERLYLTPLGLPPGSNWCAAAVRSWVVRAAKALGIEAPAIGGPGAKAIIEQVKAAGGEWIDAANLRPEDVEAGMVFVEDRSVPGRPETAWWGHTGLVAGAAVGGRYYPSVEGNSGPLGDQVADMRRDLRSPRLLGMGRFPKRLDEVPAHS